jgi:hypothetical protein
MIIILSMEKSKKNRGTLIPALGVSSVFPHLSIHYYIKIELIFSRVLSPTGMSKVSEVVVPSQPDP